ncbi:hypothetical protein H696_00022 [Fonticula alba]|uniref:Uncharacterized protein n=1 Tax=Fonticula alba TaxID=691883 RepID=A0A058ZDE4_FONAL|nr:hypothetical protein H696_00022 [Fonticula alba]KCV72435.1 hypothetical protein H696_00022 [Fonticula alba]|eukprot:XP_009492136.1 hypothetical protein H696_00022 [Fonticula alba]
MPAAAMPGGGAAAPRQTPLLGLMVMLLASLMALAAGQQPALPTSDYCNGPGETAYSGGCYPALRRCQRSIYTQADLICTQYKPEYHTVDGFGFLAEELPDLAVSGAGLVQIGPADCWNVVPGNYRRCAVCRFQAAGDGLCRPEPLAHAQCTALAHPHINEDCAACAPGHWLDLDRRCVDTCPAASHLACGAHCIPRHRVPGGFECAAWPMATMAPSDDEPAGRPEHRHLLRSGSQAQPRDHPA